MAQMRQNYENKNHGIICIIKDRIRSRYGSFPVVLNIHYVSFFKTLTYYSP